jgi:high-affinity K+ transport system ATPase subunit B
MFTASTPTFAETLHLQFLFVISVIIVFTIYLLDVDVVVVKYYCFLVSLIQTTIGAELKGQSPVDIVCVYQSKKCYYAFICSKYRCDV